MIKTILKIIGYFQVVFTALFFIVILVNLSDEPLKPEVKKALAWQLPEQALDNNGYLILLGMDAPTDQDAYQVGKKKLEAELLRYQTTQNTQKEPPSTSEPQDHKLLNELQSNFCDYKKVQNCVDFYLKQNIAHDNALFESSKTLENRYDAIKLNETYIEVTPPLLSAFLLPPYQYLVYASELVRIKVVLDVSAGKLDKGIERWLENVAFSRRLLRESNSLVSRMIAVSLLQRDIRILSELITTYPQLATQYAEQLKANLASISAPEYSMKKVLIFERNWSLPIVGGIKNEDLNDTYTDLSVWRKKVTGLFFQPNAAVNLFYNWGTIRLMLADSDARHLDETKAKIYAQQKELLGFGYEHLYLKNPIAKILLQVSGTELYEGYIERQHDTDGYISLVGLQVALAVDKAITQEQISEILPKFTNPYTGQPMVFDREHNQIIFEGRRQSSVGENNLFKIRLP